MYVYNDVAESHSLNVENLNGQPKRPGWTFFFPPAFMHTAYPIGCGSKHYYEDHCNGSQITAWQGKNSTNYGVSLVYGRL